MTQVSANPWTCFYPYLVTSTIHSLLVVSVAYTFVDNLGQFTRRLLRKKLADMLAASGP